MLKLVITMFAAALAMLVSGREDVRATPSSNNQVKNASLSSPLAPLQLHDGFTLTYEVHLVDLRTKQMRYDDAQAIKLYPLWRYQLMRGLLRPAEVDAKIRSSQDEVKQDVPTATYVVTVSADADCFMYRCRQVGGSSNVSCVFNGFYSQIVGSDGKLVSYGSFPIERLNKCLLPGVGLPYIPLVKLSAKKIVQRNSIPCQVATLSPWTPPGDVDLYAPGSISLAGNPGEGWVKKALCGPASNPWQEWDYDSPRSLHGRWIASHALWKRYRSMGKGQPIVEARAEYQLLSLSSSALSPEDFLSGLGTAKPPQSGGLFTYEPAPDGQPQTPSDILNNARQHNAAILEKSREVGTQIENDSTVHGDGASSEAMLHAAEARARSSGKNVYLVFHASWCGSCVLLHRFLNEPDVKSVMDRHYIVLEIDIFERGQSKWENPGGHDMFVQLGGGVSNSIPFYAILDPSGHLLANSILQGSNIGLPSSDSEIRMFAQQMRATSPDITADELSTLSTELHNIRVEYR